MKHIHDDEVICAKCYSEAVGFCVGILRDEIIDHEENEKRVEKIITPTQVLEEAIDSLEVNLDYLLSGD